MGLLAYLGFPGRLFELPDPTEKLDERDTAMIRALAALVLPRMPGKGAALDDIVDFVVRAVGYGLFGASPALVADVAKALDARANGDFLARSKDQASLLRIFDADAYRPEAIEVLSGWPVLKTLILAGYYTSEAGASEDLAYELAPGRFDPDIPIDNNSRALSNDWAAVNVRPRVVKKT